MHLTVEQMIGFISEMSIINVYINNMVEKSGYELTSFRTDLMAQSESLKRLK